MNLVKSPSRVSASTREGWNIIERVVDFTHAVGRIGGRGSGLLISVPNAANTGGSGSVERVGILLTSSFVLNSRAACAGESITFFESPVTGTHAKWNVAPVTVPLRPESTFYCSVRGDDAKLQKQASTDGADEETTVTEELGYTIVACDLHSERSVAVDISRVNPLPLPLIVSKIPTIAVGDTHLLITHQNSQDRRYVVAVVAEVHSHHCVYTHTDADCLFSSGGPIFTEQGEFVGMQHQCGENSFGIFVKDIVQHLFESAMLGLCKIPVYDADSGDAGGGVEKGNANAKLTNEEFNSPFSVTSREKLIDVGAGDQIVDFYVLEREREKKAKGTSTPATLIPRDHVEVWKEWYKPKEYRSLVLLLHAFPYQAKLVLLIVTELTSHHNRMSISNLASLGGIGILLETLDSHPYDEPLVQATVASLARISLYEANREAIGRSDGIAAVISIMKEYRLNYAIQEWATYCLLNMCIDSSSGEQMPESIENLVKYGGLDTVIVNMRDHAKGRYLQRWSAQLLGTVALYSSAYLNMLLQYQLLPRLDDRLHQYEEDGFVLHGLVSFLRNVFKAAVPAVKTAKSSSTVSSKGSIVDGGAASSSSSLDEALRRKSSVQVPAEAKPQPIAEGSSSKPTPSSDFMDPFKYLKDRNILERLVHVLSFHCGKNDDALLFEHTVSALNYLFEADSSLISKASEELGLEALLEQVARHFMTEINLHAAAIRVFKQLGVTHPLEKYSFLQCK